jgi:hypothetical protein
VGNGSTLSSKTRQPSASCRKPSPLEVSALVLILL